MARQFVYFMQGLTKSYPTRKVLDNVHLSFYPDAKIGVLGVNGSGKSTLLRIMAGIDKEYTGEAWVAEGARVGYLEQEPHLDASKNVRENVMDRLPKVGRAIVGRAERVAIGAGDRRDGGRDRRPTEARRTLIRLRERPPGEEDRGSREVGRG